MDMEKIIETASAILALPLLALLLVMACGM